MFSNVNLSIFWVLFSAVLGVCHCLEESNNYTGDRDTDIWISKVVEEVQIRKKRADDEDQNKPINAPDYFEFFDDNGQKIYYADKQWDKLQAVKFNSEDFTGKQSDTIARLWWSKNVLQQCFGVFIEHQTIVTPCSCLTDPSNKELTPWNHLIDRKNLTFYHGSEIYISPINLQDKTKSALVFRGDSVVPHPKCDNYFEVDIAAIITVTPIPFIKLVWVHTAENILFDENIVRIVSAQAVFGKCSVPVVTEHTDRFSNAKTISAEFEKVFFQHWEGCLPNVCPEWIDRKHPVAGLKLRRCLNQYFGTRYCIGWKAPSSKGLCSQLPGTPVFCEVGDIQGFVGFVVNSSYTCPDHQDNQAIMQGFNNAIFWIKKILELGTYRYYETYIPGWVKNFRRHEVPRIKVAKPESAKISLGQFSFDKFEGSVVESIVRVYWKDVFKCKGTLISLTVAILPCSCVTTTDRKTRYKLSTPSDRYSNHSTSTLAKVLRSLRSGLFKLPYSSPDPSSSVKIVFIQLINFFQCVDEYDYKIKITADVWYLEHVAPSLLEEKFIKATAQSSWNRNERKYTTGVTEVVLHPQCDNHYVYDYAYIKLIRPPRNPRPAWIMTLNLERFKRAIWNLPQSDMVYGYCYYAFGEWKNPLGVKGVGEYVPRTRRVRFENWNSCLKVLCSDEALKRVYSKDFQKGFIEERCLSPSLTGRYNFEHFVENSSHFCVSADPYDGTDAPPLCDIDNGTPLFCNTQEARGFVGFFSAAWSHCPPKTDSSSRIEKDKAIFFGLDQFLDHFKDKTLLWSVKDLLPLSSAKPLLLRMSLSHPPLILLASLTIGLMF